MTGKQELLLTRLRAAGPDGLYLRGADVRVCRALVAQGLATLDDNGEMSDPWGRVDGERWSAKAVTMGGGAT